jgi:hypothetical protein
MSRGNFRSRNPLCAAFESIGVEDVGWCKPRQGHINSPAAVEAEEIARRKAAYLHLARATSYIMPVRSFYRSTWNAARRALDPDAKPEDEESILGGRFLRMYLDQSIDRELIEEAGIAIQESADFAKLRNELCVQLQRAADRTKSPLDSAAVRAIADKHVKSMIAKGIKWQSGGLNPVIGGVGGLEVPTAELVSRQHVPGVHQAVVVYQLTLVVKDTYDFENSRGGEYDRLRKELAQLLANNRFVDFEARLADYGFDPNSAFIRTYRYTSLFASFMYALEKRGWTGPGVPWQVRLPMTVQFTDQLAGARAARNLP